MTRSTRRTVLGAMAVAVASPQTLAATEADDADPALSRALSAYRRQDEACRVLQDKAAAIYEAADPSEPDAILQEHLVDCWMHLPETVVPRWKEARAHFNARLEALGYQQAEDDLSDAWSVRFDLCSQAAKTPARTLRGVIAKIDVLDADREAFSDSDLGLEWSAIYADLKRIAGAGS